MLQPYATGPALILVGSLMMTHARNIEWDNVRVAVPSFITMIMMVSATGSCVGVVVCVAAKFVYVSRNSVLQTAAKKGSHRRQP